MWKLIHIILCLIRYRFLRDFIIHETRFNTFLSWTHCCLISSIKQQIFPPGDLSDKHLKASREQSRLNHTKPRLRNYPSETYSCKTMFIWRERRVPTDHIQINKNMTQNPQNIFFWRTAENIKMSYLERARKIQGIRSSTFYSVLVPSSNALKSPQASISSPVR